MLKFNSVYINDQYILAGFLEKQTGLKDVDMFIDDYYFEEDTIEKAELKMQKTALTNLIKNEKPELVVGGELSNQLGTTNMNMADRAIPYLGIYSACASSAQGLIMLANMISNKTIKNGVFITSSHNLTAEKQFRFPIEYGAPKPIRSTFTATAAVGIKVTNTPSKIKILNGTIGAVVDSAVKDVHNVGAVMAPSAVDTLLRHLKATKTKVTDYDLILTGDLGKVGVDLFKKLLEKQEIKLTNHLDAGCMLYKNIEFSGASGPAVLPLMLLTTIIPSKKYKKILYLATGALYSPVLVFQKNPLPAVTHAVTLEVM